MLGWGKELNALKLKPGFDQNLGIVPLGAIPATCQESP